MPEKEMERFSTLSPLNVSETVSVAFNYSCHQGSLYYPDYTQKFGYHLLLVVVWICVIVIKFFGNFLVVITICRSPSLKTVTNYYITNMSLIDMVIAAIVMPFKLIQYAAPCSISSNIFGTIMCKITEYLFMILVFTSLFTVIIISVERYIAILHPMKVYMLHKNYRTWIIMMITWAIPMLLSIPSLIYTGVEQSNTHSEYGSISRLFCNQQYPFDKLKTIIWLFFILCYLMPLCVVSFTSLKIVLRLLKPISAIVSFQNSNSSSRKVVQKVKHQENKRKVAKMIVVIAFLYYLSWTPFYVTQVVALHTNFMSRRNYFFSFLIVLLFSFFNSMANPIVYYFMSRKIRKQMISVLICIFKPNNQWKGMNFYNQQSFNSNNLKTRNGEMNILEVTNRNPTVVIKQYYSAL